MVHKVKCDVDGCIVGWYLHGQRRTHDKAYHKNNTVRWKHNGVKRELIRDENGYFTCWCGQESHKRANYDRMASLVKLHKDDDEKHMTIDAFYDDKREDYEDGVLLVQQHPNPVFTEDAPPGDTEFTFDDGVDTGPEPNVPQDDDAMPDQENEPDMMDVDSRDVDTREVDVDMDNVADDPDAMEDRLSQMSDLTESTATSKVPSYVNDTMDIPEEEMIASLAEKDEARVFLDKHGFLVDDVYHRIVCGDCQEVVMFNFVWGHRHARHETYTRRHPIPPKEEFAKALTALGAHAPILFPPYTVLKPLPVLTVFSDGYKCLFPDCSHPTRIFRTRRRVVDHYNTDHTRVPVKARLFIGGIRCQRMGTFGDGRKYYEVEPMETTIMDAYALLLADAERLGLDSDSPVYVAAKNQRLLDPMVSQLKWHLVINNVDLEVLRATLLVPRKDDPLHAVFDAVLAYYKDVGASIVQLPTVVLRLVRTSLQNDIKKRPFMRVQEDQTLVTYSDYMATFLLFLYRHHISPVPNFNVPFHPNVLAALSALLETVLKTDCPPEDAMDAVHNLVWALLVHASEESCKDESLDLFHLFLVVASLRDNHGRFVNPARITPNISKLQWCFRATACEYLLRAQETSKSNVLDLYEEHVRIHIRDAEKIGLFTVLRQKQALISHLAMIQPGLPRFGWNMSNTVVSIDGIPIPLKLIYKACHDGVRMLEAKIRALVPDFDPDEIYAYIDPRLNSSDDNALQWFRDNTREDRHGYSFLSDASNGLEQFRPVLTQHIANNNKFFKKSSTGLQMKTERLWQFLRELDEIVELAYFLVCFMSGGTPRGSDAEGLRIINTAGGQRHVFIYQGMLAIITVYSKTLQNTGRAEPRARFPPADLSRHLIVLWNTLYDSAKYVAGKLFTAKEGQSYSQYVFVLSGDFMTSRKYSSALSRHTERTLLVPLGLRDVRQLLDSVLKQTTRGSLEQGDSVMALEEGVDEQTGHSSDIAQRHYALDFGAVDSMSIGVLSLFQRVSVRWHLALGFACPSIAKQVAVAKQDNPNMTHGDIYQAVLPILDSMRDSLAKLREDLSRIFEQRTLEAVTAISVQLQPRSAYAFPPVQVHPQLRLALRRVNPNDSNPQFKTPEQAEVIQLLLGDTPYCILLVSPTGYGKTFMVSVIAAHCPNKVVVVITPFVATTRDLRRRIQGQPGIRAVAWDENEGRECNADENLVIISAHLVNGAKFRTWCETSVERIQGIVIDECHEMIISKYRNTFEFFPHLAALGKPFLLLTATLFPSSEPALLKMLGVDPRILRVFRVQTHRPNIVYKVEHHDNEDEAIKRVRELMETHKLAAGEKGLIYCTTREQTERVAKLFHLPFYHAKMDPDEEKNSELKDEFHMNWMYSTAPEWAWGVATFAFGCGIDNARVLVCIHLLMPPLLRFLQESGRLGRMGQKSFSYTLSYPTRVFPPKAEDVHLGVAERRQYLVTTSCRRLILGLFDGDTRHSCGSLANAELCDNCQILSVKPLDSTIQPLNLHPVLALPEVDGPVRIQPVTCKTEGDKLARLRELSRQTLQKAMEILQDIELSGCVDCWIGARLQQSIQSYLEHIHRDTPETIAALDKVAQIQFPQYVEWAFCYRCWICFQAPGHHPRHEVGVELDPSNCPGKAGEKKMLVRFAVILFRLGGRNVLNRHICKDLDSFTRWLQTKPGHTYALPTVYHLLIDFDKMYPKPPAPAPTA